MLQVRVFVADPANPQDLAQSCISRAKAAAGRFGDRVQTQVLALDSPEAAELGVSVDPTVAVGDLVVTIGQPARAGHLVRAIELALEDE